MLCVRGRSLDATVLPRHFRGLHICAIAMGIWETGASTIRVEGLGCPAG